MPSGLSSTAYVLITDSLWQSVLAKLTYFVYPEPHHFPSEATT